MELRHRAGAALGGAEVTRGIRPPARESRSQQDDGVGRDRTVLGPGTCQIVNGDLIIRALLALLRYVDHDGGAEEPLQRNLVDALPALREMNRRIQDAIQSLPPRCRLVFKLIKEDGLSYRETAELLELSLKTIENQMTIAFRKIGECIRLELPKHSLN